MSSKTWSYKRAGIDLDKHSLMHDQALRAIEGVAAHLGVRIGGLGGYAAWFRLGNRRIALHMDGVGTKTLVLGSTGKLWVAGWDCVAMNVNDLAVAGFRPLALVDYVAMPSSDEEAFAEIIRGLAEASKKARVAILGGETAILPDLARGIDVVCSVLGEALSTDYRGQAEPGDVLIGVESNGLHANGYTLARKILEQRFGDYKATYRDINFGEELSRPTYIYSNLIIEAMEKGLIHAAAHITGGAFTKLRRILGENTYAEINAPEPPRVFQALMELGNIEPEEMYRVFNMGIGLIFSSPPDKVPELRQLIEKHGFKHFLIGSVRIGSPRIIIIDTPWGERVEYKI